MALQQRWPEAGIAVLAEQLHFTTARAEQILEVCDLLNRDFVTEQADEAS